MSHSSVHPGLQNHSIGELYPLSIKVADNAKQRRGSCVVWHCLTNAELASFPYVTDSRFPEEKRDFLSAHRKAEAFAEKYLADSVQTQHGQRADYLETMQELGELAYEPPAFSGSASLVAKYLCKNCNQFWFELVASYDQQDICLGCRGWLDPVDCVELKNSTLVQPCW